MNNQTKLRYTAERTQPSLDNLHRVLIQQPVGLIKSS
jgi:hypothetical protein